jgi:hypothetical protein
MSEFERDERIAVLERRLQRRTPVGVSAPVAALAMALAVAAIWIFERRDWAYFVSPAQAVWLGREGEYRWELLQSNRFVEIHGAPTARGLYGPESDGVMVVVGLRDTPVLVRRRALPGEDWKPGQGTPPQPNQRPFAVSGRLLAVDDAPAWARQAADELRKSDEVRPVDGKLWVLIAGERPRSNRSVLLVTALLLTFTALNAYFLAKALRHRLRRG